MSHRNTVITCVNLLYVFMEGVYDGVDAFFVDDGGVERLDV